MKLPSELAPVSLLAGLVESWEVEAEKWRDAQKQEAMHSNDFKLRAGCYADVFARCAKELRKAMASYRKPTDEEIRLWAANHGFDGHSLNDLRCAFEDAQTMTHNDEMRRGAK